MLEGLLRMEDGNKLVFLFVRYFHGSLSTHVWEDEIVVTNEIHEGEGAQIFGGSPSSVEGE